MIFRGKKINEKKGVPEQIKKPDYEVVISPNGNQVEFIDNVYKPDAISGEPNITRIIFGQPYVEKGQRIATDGQIYSGLPEQTNKGIQPLYHAKVSWYNKSDTIIIEKDGSERSRRAAGVDVILGVDINRINRKDMEYCKLLFLELLERSRVEQYRYTGLQVDPASSTDSYCKKVKCGNYIGHVKPLKYGGYTEYFSGTVGARVHDSPVMVTKRKEYYEIIVSTIDRENEEDQEKILTIQKRIASRDERKRKAAATLKQIKGQPDMEI